MSLDIIIRGAMVVSHQGIEKADIAVRDGIIVAIGHFSDLKAEQVIDAKGLHVLPGVIDTDFHIAGGVVADGRAAIKGGFTSLITVGKCAENLACDHGYFVEANGDNISELARIEQQEGCAGIHLSMAPSNNFDVIVDDKTLLKVMKNGRRRIAVHAEDADVLDAQHSIIKQGNVSTHSDWRNETVALDATRRIIAIARGAGRPIHIEHVANEKQMAMIAANKDIVTAAVTPHHLSLSAPECYDHYQTYAQIDPPIGPDSNRIGLWKALNSGIVDMLASQHMPHSIDLKDQDYPNSPSGCPSIQTMLPMMLAQVNEGTLSLQTLMDLTSAGPARAFNIARKGRIAVGYDADFTFMDLHKEWILDDDEVESNCGWDLQAGNTFKGQVTGTMIRGQLALWDGETIEGGKGRPLQFHDTFQAYEDE